MESKSLGQEVNPTVGFTLELDGDPTEIQRILNAVGKEMDAIRFDNSKQDRDSLFIGRSRRFLPFLFGDLNVRGMIHLRKGI